MWFVCVWKGRRIWHNNFIMENDGELFFYCGFFRWNPTSTNCFLNFIEFFHDIHYSNAFFFSFLSASLVQFCAFFISHSHPFFFFLWVGSCISWIVPRLLSHNLWPFLWSNFIAAFFLKLPFQCNPCHSFLRKKNIWRGTSGRGHRWGLLK